jgi:hypothetical protein
MQKCFCNNLDYSYVINVTIKIIPNKWHKYETQIYDEL